MGVLYNKLSYRMENVYLRILKVDYNLLSLRIKTFLTFFRWEILMNDY